MQCGFFDNESGNVIGSSRYYEWNEAQRTIAIGYTFMARSHWGRGHNRQLKMLTLEHAFQFVDSVLFHVGESNMRSRMALQKLRASLIGEAAIAYYGEPSNRNVIYRIERADWLRLRQQT